MQHKQVLNTVITPGVMNGTKAKSLKSTAVVKDSTPSILLLMLTPILLVVLLSVFMISSVMFGNGLMSIKMSIPELLLSVVVHITKLKIVNNISLKLIAMTNTVNIYSCLPQSIVAEPLVSVVSEILRRVLPLWVTANSQTTNAKQCKIYFSTYINTTIIFT